MSVDLYEVLGVAKDAKPDELRKAYRRAAKRAHPDGGGSVERFALVRVAVETLTDEGRRERYDRTGEIGDKPVDQREATAMTAAMGAVDTVVMKIIRRGARPEHFDVVADAVRHVAEVRAGVEAKAGKAEDEARALRAMAKRFRARKGKPNRIRAMLEARADEAHRGALKLEDEIVTLRRAEEILGEHEFDFELAAAPSGAGVFGAQNFFVNFSSRTG